MSTKTITLITGGNTGLGYEIVKALYQSPQPYEIIIGARTPSKASDAIKKLQSEISSSASTLSTLEIDVTSDSSIDKAGAELTSRHGHLDVLINNSGAAFDQDIRSGAKTIREAWNASWDVNVSGTHVLTHVLMPLTHVLMPLLLKSSAPRLLFVTSGTANLHLTQDLSHRLSAAPAAGWPKPEVWGATSYRSAKTGLNMMAREWERVLRNDGVKVFMISPGMLATGLGGNPEFLRKIGAEEPEVGGIFVKDVVEGKRDTDVGLVVSRGGVQPW